MSEEVALAGCPVEDRRAKTMRRIGLAAIAMGGFSASLWSQGAAPPRKVETVIDQPFARFDASLMSAADTLNASVAPNAANPAAKVPPYEISSASSVKHRERLSDHCLVKGAMRVADIRTNLLRPAVEAILRSHGVPIELASVILVESGGHSTALSSKGARGLWQLMPDTARRYGLRVDAGQDDRLDTWASTDAAARYLRDLYAQFNDWKLALAAYNTGESNVASAILRARTQDFDQLTRLRMLPIETLEYVPKVLAHVNYDWQIWTVGKDYHPTTSVIVFADNSR